MATACYITRSTASVYWMHHSRRPALHCCIQYAVLSLLLVLGVTTSSHSFTLPHPALNPSFDSVYTRYWMPKPLLLHHTDAPKLQSMDTEQIHIMKGGVLPPDMRELSCSTSSNKPCTPASLKLGKLFHHASRSMVHRAAFQSSAQHNIALRTLLL